MCRFRWKQQFRQEYPEASNQKGKGDDQIEYQPAPRITEADKSNDRRSLQRALDRRLYLLLHGPASASPNDGPIWHFPEKPYENEETMRKVILGKADSNAMKRFFFKSHVIASTKLDIVGCDDFVWVTKDELLEYFPNEEEYLNHMIIS